MVKVRGGMDAGIFAGRCAIAGQSIAWAWAGYGANVSARSWLNRVQSRTLVLVSVLHDTLKAQNRAPLNMFEP